MNKLYKLRNILKSIKLIYQYIKDPGVSLFNKGLALLPLFYIISPFDGDFFPVVGWLDDILVAVVIWSYILNKISAYKSDDKDTAETEVDYEVNNDEYDVE